MPLPNPTTLWKFVKWGIKGAEIALPPAYAYLESLRAGEHEAMTPSWVRVVVVCDRASATGTTEDSCQFKFDLVNITDGVLDTSWTSADLDNVDGHLDTFIASLAAYTSNQVTFDQFRFYAMQYSDVPDVLHPFVDSGPPIRISEVNTVGSVASTMAFQVAATVTFRTAWPKHWGRIYLPNPAHGSVAVIDAHGRFAPQYTQNVVEIVHTLISDLADDGFLLTVPVQQVGKNPYHELLGVSQIVMDDIPDVVRRRRPRTVARQDIGS